MGGDPVQLNDLLLNQVLHYPVSVDKVPSNLAV